MSRIRTIKPEFFRHAELFEAEKSSGLPLRVAFAAIWTVADRDGRFRWKPRELKLDCLPYDDVDFEKVLHSLAKGGFIVKYSNGSEQYGFVPSFSSHQVLNIREPPSKLPDPSASGSNHNLSIYLDSTGTVPEQYRASREGEGEREREGKDKKPKPLVLSKKITKHRTSIGEDEQPVEADIDFARNAGMDSRQISEAWAQFRDHHRSRGNLMADWRATWRTWVRNASKFEARGSPNGRGRSNGNEGFIKSVLEDIENDRRRREESASKVVPMLQRDRK